MFSKRKLAIIVFALTALLGIASVNALPMFHSYPADIQLDGTLTLKSITTDFESEEIHIITNFTALVPFFINPGVYEAINFTGRAIVSDDSIKFKGLILILSPAIPILRRGNFWVNFRVEKPADVSLPDGMYIAIGEASITISPIVPGPARVVWVHMKGFVTSYGGEDSYGGIVAHARIGEWARVHGFFTKQIIAYDISEDYTFSFFAFRLVNTTMVELNYEDDDLFISGLWNVYNVTWTYYDHDWTLKVEQLIEEEYGELVVTLESEGYTEVSIPEAGHFTLGIIGLESIEGAVSFYHLRYCSPIELPAPMTDFNGDWKVNMLDIANIALRYGATIGRPGYNFFLDINFDYVINILDLGSVAQAFGQEY